MIYILEMIEEEEPVYRFYKYRIEENEKRLWIALSIISSCI